MSVEGITRTEAEKLLGIHPQTMSRALENKVFELIEQPDGRRLIKREGLEEAWANRKRERIRKSSGPPPPPRPSRPSPGGGLEAWELPAIPNGAEAPRLEEQKAWNEFTKRYREQLALMKEAELLVYKEDYDKAQNAVLQEIVRQCERLPKTIQQRIPKLTVEDMEEIEDMIREMLGSIANSEFTELEE